MTEIFIGERKKMDKVNDKQEEADSFLHNTTSRTKTKTIHPLYTSYAGG